MRPSLFIGLVLFSSMLIVATFLVLMEPAADNEANGTPEITFVVDTERHQARVNSTESGLKWDNFQVMFSRAGAYQIGGEGNQSWVEPLVFTRITDERAVEPDTRIWFCLENGGRDLEVGLRHRETDQVVETFHFPNVLSCEELAAQDEPDE